MIEMLKLKGDMNELKESFSKKTEEASGGNHLVFLAFLVCNIFVFLTGIGVMGCAIYLFVMTKQVNAFNICFTIAGLVILTFSALSFKMRESVHLIGIYLAILLVIFLFECLVTIVTMANKQKIVDIAISVIHDEKVTDELKD
jgi:hypothetical protein